MNWQPNILLIRNNTGKKDTMIQKFTFNCLCPFFPPFGERRQNMAILRGRFHEPNRTWTLRGVYFLLSSLRLPPRGDRRQGWEVTVDDQKGPLDHTLYLSLPLPALDDPARATPCIIVFYSVTLWAARVLSPQHRCFPSSAHDCSFYFDIVITCLVNRVNVIMDI